MIRPYRNGKVLAGGPGHRGIHLGPLNHTRIKLPTSFPRGKRSWIGRFHCGFLIGAKTHQGRNYSRGSVIPTSCDMEHNSRPANQSNGRTHPASIGEKRCVLSWRSGPVPDNVRALCHGTIVEWRTSPDTVLFGRVSMLLSNLFVHCGALRGGKQPAAMTTEPLLLLSRPNDLTALGWSSWLSGSRPQR